MVCRNEDEQERGMVACFAMMGLLAGNWSAFPDIPGMAVKLAENLLAELDKTKEKAE
jgi:hypothetical protein